MWLARVQGPRTPAKPVKTMWSGAFTSAPAPATVLMATFTSALEVLCNPLLPFFPSLLL
jgi:hypothetical protein